MLLLIGPALFYTQVFLFSIMILLGLLVGQGCTLALAPEQPFPPQKGTGLLHFLLHCFVPSPHVALHDPHVHELHPPSTTQ